MNDNKNMKNRAEHVFDCANKDGRIELKLYYWATP